MYEQAVAADSAHLNALLNMGVVREDALRDTAGARQAWERYLRVSPSGADAERVRQMIGALRSRRG